MSGSATDRVGALAEDIEAGPDELAAVLHAQSAAIRDLPLGALARPTWRFVGMGSSRFAAMDAAARLRAAGRDAHAELATAAGGSPGGRDTLVVAVSASGGTPDVIAAAERHHGASFVLGLTARTDSPLARASDAVVPLGAAFVERAGIATMTYRATVAALVALTADGDPELTRRSLAAAPAALRELVAGRHRWLGDAADLLDEGRPVHVLGDGARAGAVEQAALMLREAPRLVAMPFDTGDWLHVGVYTLVPGDPVVLFRGSAADGEAVHGARLRGAPVVAVGPGNIGTIAADVTVPLPESAHEDAVVRAIVEPAVADLLALELWRRTGASDLGEQRRP